MAKPDRQTAAAAKRDPVDFIETVLVNPETGRPFELYPQQEAFLRRAFITTPDGRLPFSEILYGCRKKSGKTHLSAFAVLYAVVALAGRFGEAIVVANDYEQATGRVFAAIVRIIEASPLLAGSAKITSNRVVFTSTGATITAIASDYGAAGSNANIVAFDELWGFVSERSRRLWDELVPPPTRKVACRLVTTYAGFENESDLLEDLYHRGLNGRKVAADTWETDHQLTYWTHDLHAPWQTPEWRKQMRATSRPAAYTRQIENRFTAGTEGFVELQAWDACVDQDHHPVVSDPRTTVWVGVDASTKRDSTAVVAVAWDSAARKVSLVTHKVFQPTLAEPLDFEGTVETALLDLRHRFMVRKVAYDPMQMASVAQRLTRSGLPMEEFAQSVPNLTAAGSNLYDLIKDRNLIAYPNDDIRRAVGHTVAVETPRGWRLAKEKTSHRIDVVAALSFGALFCVREAPRGDSSVTAADLRVIPYNETGGGDRLFGGRYDQDGNRRIAQGPDGNWHCFPNYRKRLSGSELLDGWSKS